MVNKSGNRRDPVSADTGTDVSGSGEPVNNDTAKGSGELDLGAPFSMVMIDGLLHYFQNNTVYDRVSRKQMTD